MYQTTKVWFKKKTYKCTWKVMLISEWTTWTNHNRNDPLIGHHKLKIPVIENIFSSAELYNIPETYVSLLTAVTPINFTSKIKKKALSVICFIILLNLICLTKKMNLKPNKRNVLVKQYSLWPVSVMRCVSDGAGLTWGRAKDGWRWEGALHWEGRWPVKRFEPGWV